MARESRGSLSATGRVLRSLLVACMDAVDTCSRGPGSSSLSEDKGLGGSAVDRGRNGPAGSLLLQAGTRDSGICKPAGAVSSGHLGGHGECNLQPVDLRVQPGILLPTIRVVLPECNRVVHCDRTSGRRCAADHARDSILAALKSREAVETETITRAGG